MGRVDAELVCAAGVWMEQYVCCAVFIDPDDFVSGKCWFALRVVDFLAGSFVVVCAERQCNLSYVADIESKRLGGVYVCVCRTESCFPDWRKI